MATTNITREFRDLDLNFNIHPVKKDITKHVGDMAVINSVRNLLSTNHYEKPFRPEIGGNIRALLFENLDTITSTLLQKEILRIVETYEPRASVEELIVQPSYESNSFSVTIRFSIINRTEPVTISFLLERLR